jgi:DNA-binding NarL/FixJ family response regulator
MIRVLIVEDQTVVREGLLTVVGLGDGIEVAGAAADGEEGIRLVHELQPDVVLMDLRMPRLDGVEATRRICGEAAAPRVIVLTTYTDDESVLAALQAGAVGYLSKDASVEDIERAIHTVHDGHALFDPEVQRLLADSLRLRLAGEALAPGPQMPGGAVPAGLARAPDGLTQREVDVLRLVASGLSNSQMASRLFISEATVKTHVHNILTKAGLRDRVQAVSYALRTGIWKPD